MMSALSPRGSAPTKPRPFPAALLLPLVAAFFCATAAHAQTITSAVPGFLTYQGKVSNANGTLVGAGTPVNRTVVFRIWSHQSNSTASDLVYSEQQTVTISEGEFSVLIGQGSVVSGTPLGYSEASKGPPTTTVGSAAVFGGASRYLGVTIDDPATSADPEISPRQQLVTSAYAFRAKYAESLGANGVNTLTTLDNGNVGIGTANPGERFEVYGNIRAGGSGRPAATLSLLANSNSQQAMSIAYSNAVGTFSSDAAAGDTVVRTENGGKLLLQTGGGASAIAVDSSNRVGIGTASPTSKLHLTVGNLDGLRVESGGSGYLEVGKTGASRWRMTNAFNADLFEIVYGAAGVAPATSRLAIDTAGNVGLGITNPAQKLHLSGGNVRIDGSGSYIELGGGVAGKEPNAGKIGYATFTTGALDITGVGTAAGADRKIKFWNEGGALFTGAVALGTSTLSQAMLTVTGTGAENLGAHSWFGYNTGFQISTGFNAGDVSIRASHTVNASQYRAISDARIKRIIGRSNSAADLALLNRIEITDYTYIDTVTRGAREYKKVIGQQVESVFPQAVTHGTDVVPDIYKRATGKGGWVELTTDLKIGERVRMIADKTDGVYEVLEVQPDRFRTSYVGNPTELFVYGREVKDFRTVDYEAVAMLGVSATQELSREVTALRTTNAALAARVAELETKDRARDAKLAAIEKLISSGQTVMARPATATTSNASGQD